MANDDYLEESERRHLLFAYITAEDDARFKRLIKDLDPLEVRKITMEGTDLTLLHWAALKGSLIIQNWLIDKMEFPPDLDNNSEVWSPAHIAVIGGRDVCLEALITRKPEVINRPDNRGCTLLHLAAAHGRYHCLHYLLNCTRVLPNINEQCKKNRWTPLMYAAWHGRVSIVELLIRHGAVTDITDNEGRTPLHLSASEGHLILVKYFLEQGCIDVQKCLTAVDNNGYTALKLAENNKKDDICKFIREKEKDPKTWELYDDIQYPGHIAALNGDLLNIKGLLEKGTIAINDTDSRGYTMLHKACIGGHLEIVKWLISKGASIWIKTLGQESITDIVRRKDHKELIKFLEDEESRYEPFLNKPEHDNRVFIPLLSSLDNPNQNSLEYKKWNELIEENKSEILNLEEMINEKEKLLFERQSRLNERNSDFNQDHRKEQKKDIKALKYEIMKLNYQLNVVKFNLYQLTKEPTLKEREIGQALADCEHEFEEITDRLFYERELREQTEAELSRIRHQLIKLRDYILKNDSPDDLISMVITFDRFLIDKDNLNVVVQKIPDKKNKMYTMQFEIGESNKITISKVSYYVDAKLVVKSNIESLSLKNFIEYIKCLIKQGMQHQRRKKRNKSKLHRKHLSPKGGIFITNRQTENDII